MNWAYWLTFITSSLVHPKTKTEKAFVVDRRQSKEHSAINTKERIQFPFPVLLKSPVSSSICPQSSYAKHNGYWFCGYILGVPNLRSSSFNNHFLYYVVRISTCINFLLTYLNTKKLLSLFIKPILLPSGEWVSVSVEPC